MVVYKSGNGVVYQNWCEGGPEGTTYAASRSGWFDMAKFNQWFKQAWVKFIPYGTGTVPTYLPYLFLVRCSKKEVR
jgi:hypothetical protein